MERYYRPTRVEISYDALQHNIDAFRQAIPEPMKIMAVVKGNAYGHGAVEIAKRALLYGVHYLGVAFLDEAIELRRAGISEPILVLGYTPPAGIAAAYEHDISITAYSEDVLPAIRALPHSGSKLKVHVKLDTGMGRLGLAVCEEAITFIDEILSIPQVHLEGLYTHYACADDRDKEPTRKQFARFERIVVYYTSQGHVFDIIHAGNTAAAMDTPEYCFNMIRLGIGMYGLYPSEEVNRQHIELIPVLRLITGVVMVKKVPAGSPISYGGTYVTKAEELIATLPIGYADGYSRMLTNNVDVLIHGQRRPVIGRICMDQCMVEVNGLDVELGDEVVLIGSQGQDRITADELAKLLGTIHYEITCMISNRVPKVYTYNGEQVSVVNPLIHH